jgi:hypothetical protein
MAFADVDVLDQGGAFSGHHLANNAAFAALFAGQNDDVVTFFYACQTHFFLFQNRWAANVFISV